MCGRIRDNMKVLQRLPMIGDRDKVLSMLGLIKVRVWIRDGQGDDSGENKERTHVTTSMSLGVRNPSA